jgi:hypothetical protein
MASSNVFPNKHGKNNRAEFKPVKVLFTDDEETPLSGS